MKINVEIDSRDIKDFRRMVNSHEALIDALETLIQAGESLQSGKRDGGTMAQVSIAIDKARDAIKLARG